jgi:hypothetical protein
MTTSARAEERSKGNGSPNDHLLVTHPHRTTNQLIQSKVVQPATLTLTLPTFLRSPLQTMPPSTVPFPPSGSFIESVRTSSARIVEASNIDASSLSHSHFKLV